MVDLTRLSRAALEAMEAHGGALLDAERGLAASGGSVVAAVLGEAQTVYEWQHYPQGDVYNPITHAQYFYHAHPCDERPPHRAGKAEAPAEHGHFHTFLRARGMPAGMRPLVLPELAIADNPAAPKTLEPSAPENAAGEEADPWTHLVAIAMDARGKPLRFFTTNRWVTGETWYAAADVAAMLDRFAIASAAPEPLVGRWVTALIGLYKPNLAELLARRDAAVMDWRRRRRAKVHVFEDRRLEITATLDIDLARQIELVAAALRCVA
ncbi:MAG TPA: hypothetical protein VJR47_16135 [Stellaceae bacterium]|nr:hypothetical protein [Stellaceae bacterium]